MKKNEELTSQIEAIYNESQNLESLVKEKTQKYLDEGKLKQNLAAYVCLSNTFTHLYFT